MRATGERTELTRTAHRRATPVLLTATVAVGLVTGVFGDWAHTVMPGLSGTDDRTFVGAFQALDRAILGPLFLLVFMGALVVTGVAAVLVRNHRSLRPWVGVAFGLYLAAVVITMAVHEPLNAVLRSAGDPGTDPGTLRAAFDPAGWAAWHVVRTAATAAAFGCLSWALVLAGRATAPDRPTRAA